MTRAAGGNGKEAGGGAVTVYRRNFGMTSFANHRSCSIITAFGVPMLVLMFTCASPGKRDSRFLRYAIRSSGGPANHAPVFM